MIGRWLDTILLGPDRYDPAGTGHHPSASGPKDDIEVAWAHDTTDWFQGTATPIRHGETIYAVGNGLLALDSETGTRQFGHSGSYQSNPARVRSSIYNTATIAVTAPSGVFGLNAGGGFDIPLLNQSLGVERWATSHSSSAGFVRLDNPASPVAANGSIYSAIPGTNAIGSIDPNDGEIQWQRTPFEDDSVSVEFNRPAVKDGLVFVTNWPRRATAYRADTGDQHWQRDFDEQMLLPPVATEEGVVVPSRDKVWLLDSSDGTILWERMLDGNVTESAPAVANGTIFVADERGPSMRSISRQESPCGRRRSMVRPRQSWLTVSCMRFDRCTRWSVSTPNLVRNGLSISRRRSHYRRRSSGMASSMPSIAIE